MLTLLSMLRQSLKSNNREYRILVLGLDNAGKTTVLKKLAGEEILHIMPTQGFNIKTVNKMGFKLNLWDIGGQKTIRGWWRNYYKGTDAIIYVVDATDKNRITETTNELHTMLSDALLKGVPLLVLANKQDLPTSIKSNDLEKLIEVNTLKDREKHIQGISAKTGNGLPEAMRWLTKTLDKRK